MWCEFLAELTFMSMNVVALICLSCLIKTSMHPFIIILSVLFTKYFELKSVHLVVLAIPILIVGFIGIK